MPEEQNMTQMQPEIPNTTDAPQDVSGVDERTPTQSPFSPPAVITPKRARKQTEENLEKLSDLTGQDFKDRL